jgi:hypothetical protein
VSISGAEVCKDSGARTPTGSKQIKY